MKTVEKREAEEIREILSAVTKFIEDLKKPISDLISMVMESLKGDKLGEDIAAFYAKLKESNLPEDMIKEMTRKYMEERVKVANILDRFISMMGKGPKAIVGVRRGEEHEAAKQC